MDPQTTQRAVRAGGWSALAGAAAVVTGSTPIGIAMVAGIGGALAWRATRRSRARR